MASELDPRGVEARALLDAVDFTRARILEIGCGDGRLTYRYARASPLVVGAEPDLEQIARAAGSCPAVAPPSVALVRADAVALPFRDASFDVALFAWSL